MEAPKETVKDYNEGLEGIEFLRGLVKTFNCRNEYLNGNKTPHQLMNEYMRYLKDETDIEGNKLD